MKQVYAVRDNETRRSKIILSFWLWAVCWINLGVIIGAFICSK